MIDFKFNWDSSIDIGISKIDQQHQELFRIGRAIEQLVITQCIGVEERYILDIICGLREFVSYHFYEEEHIMELYGLEQLESHRAQHDRYRKMILDIDPRSFNQNAYEKMSQLKLELSDAIFSHVLIADKEIAESIKKKQLLTA